MRSLPATATRRLDGPVGLRNRLWATAPLLPGLLQTPWADVDPQQRLGEWFQGGGFTSGSGGWDWYNGARLTALGDMGVVTANYRVGPLGYL